MHRGALLPLDFVTRIQSSKFWMMESDTWADLLIICRWANPTTKYCKTCRAETDHIPTDCKHDVCRICLLEWSKKHNTMSCPDCGIDLVVKIQLGSKSKIMGSNSILYQTWGRCRVHLR